jgi:hypothetical protein
MIARRGSTGGLGNLGLAELKKRIRRAVSWRAQESRRFNRAIQKLVGSTVDRAAGPSARAR